MRSPFDEHTTTYETMVQDSVAFSGLKHDFFLKAKVACLTALFRERFGTRGPTLLDVGCGVGRMHPLLRPVVSGLAGTDVSEQALDRARRDNPGVDYRPSGRDGLPWPDASFDVALAVCVIHHVPLAGRDGLLTEMRRVTSPGGIVVVIEHNPLNPLTQLAVAKCPFDNDAQLLGARHSCKLLERAMLKRVETRHFLLLPTAATWAGRVERLLWRLPLGAQYLAVGEV